MDKSFNAIDSYFICGLFSAVFFGILTLEITVLFFLVYSLSRWLAEPHGDIKRWLRKYHLALFFFVVIIIGSVGHLLLVPEASRWDIHWGLMMIWAVSYRNLPTIQWEKLHRAMLVASVPGLLFSIYWLLQPAEIEWALQVGFKGYPRAAGFLSNPITHAEALVLLAAWSLARLETNLEDRERQLIWTHIAVCILIVLFSRVRSGLVGFALLLILHGLSHTRHRKACLTLGAAVCAGFVTILPLFGFNTASLVERVALFQQYLGSVSQFWLWGIGPDNFDFYQNASGVALTHPHNTLIGIFVELGIIGLILFLALMVFLIFKIASLFLCDMETAAPPWVARVLAYELGLFLLFGLFDFNFADTELLVFHALHWGVLLSLAEGNRVGAVLPTFWKAGFRTKAIEKSDTVGSLVWSRRS